MRRRQGDGGNRELPPLWWHIEPWRSGPTYDLDAIKAAIGWIETLAITSSALRHATSLGFERAGIIEVIGSIERKMFFRRTS
jgi:hypothetical protein